MQGLPPRNEGGLGSGALAGRGPLWTRGMPLPVEAAGTWDWRRSSAKS